MDSVTRDPRREAEIETPCLTRHHKPVRKPERRLRLAAAHHVFNHVYARHGLLRRDDRLLKGAWWTALEWLHEHLFKDFVSDRSCAGEFESLDDCIRFGPLRCFVQ